MSDHDTLRVTGSANTMLTTNGSRRPTRVATTLCDKQVPRASDSIYGQCNYYYEPLMFGQLRYLRQNGPQDAPPISFPQEDGVDKTGVRLDEFLETLILVDDVYYALRDVVFGPSTDNSENVLSRSLKDRIIVERVLKHHDELLDPECIVGWSRYGNFWARHVGCGHLPPDYYTH